MSDIKLFGDFDNDGDRDLYDIYGYISYYCERVDKSDLTGEEKKQKVMKDIQLLLPTKTFERYTPMISKGIDFIILLSKKPEIIAKINTTIKKCFTCV